MPDDVLLFTANLVEAEREIEARSGRATHLLTERVLVCCLPPGSRPEELAACSLEAPEDLDPLSALAAAAWADALAIEERGITIPEHTERLPWDEPGYAEPSVSLEGSGSSPALTGRVDVEVVWPEGSDAAMRRSLLAEVAAALAFLAKAEPSARLCFRCRFSEPGEPGDSTAPLRIVLSEEPRRRPAALEGREIVLSSNGGAWGPGNLHRLLAYLVARRFGAQAEHGPALDPGDRAECLLKTNTLRLCEGCREALAWAPADLGPPLLLLHRGRNDDSLWYATSDGSTWSLDVQCPDHGSSHEPALAVFDGALHAVYRSRGGPGQNDYLQHAVFDGRRWSAEVPLPGLESAAGPALAAFGGRLACLFRGAADPRLRVSFFAGTSWSRGEALPGHLSAAGPALAAFGDRLFCLHRGSRDEGLWLAAFDGTRWSEDRALPRHSTAERPALAVFEGTLICAYKDSGANRLWWTRSEDGDTWSPPRRLGAFEATRAPALAAWSGGLLCATTAGPRDHLRFSRFDGGSWSDPYDLPYHKAAASPALAALPWRGSRGLKGRRAR